MCVGPAVCFAALTLACIDTSVVDAAVGGARCPLANSSPTLVFVTASLGSLGTIRCSGVAVSRTLVMTARGCVAVPNALRGSYPPPEDDSAPLTGDIYYADSVEEGGCQQMRAVEDGSLSTSFGDTLPPGAFDVYTSLERVTRRGLVVTEIIAPSGSRCAQGIALLRLESGLDAGALTIGAMQSQASNDTTLSHVAVGAAYTLERHDVPVPVANGANGSSLLPTSFEAPDTCPEQTGGAFFSNSTGALVGVLASSLGSPDCTQPASGVVVPVMPFWALLEETAAPDTIALEGECSLD